jgi:SOS response regulatory protein OraA/RecX
LRARELSDDIVEYEIDRLERVGLLDDAALAETLVRTLRERKQLGRSAITAELQRRGIDRGTIATAIEGADDDPDDELQRAVELAQQRARQLGSLDHATAQRRLSGFLMRRGYSGSIVSTAVQRALRPTTGSGPAFR